MKRPRDQAIVVALEYEDAVINARHVLTSTDQQVQRTAFVRFADAAAAIEALPVEDYNRVGMFLTERAKIADRDLKEVVDGMEALAKRMDLN